MEIDFYYWGLQCPINEESLLLLEKYKDKINISTYDVTNNFQLAEQMNMYFPFLTVVDKKRRFYSPLKESFLNNLLNKVEMTEKPYIIKTSEKQFIGEIIPLTIDNIEMVSSGCTLGNCKRACTKKGRFISEFGEKIYGYTNVKNGEILGGAEYLPSTVVPYKIPREKDAAFITCVYHSSEEYDFKVAPLKKLETYLKNRYKKIYAVADEIGTFPNGDLNWFIKQGYEDKGIIYVDKGYCTLHLVEKIRPNLS